MIRRGLFRSHIAFVDVADNKVTKTLWSKGSVQPYKRGVVLEFTDAGFRYKDWITLYVKEVPPAPVDGNTLRYFTDDGKWYRFESVEDWTTQSRGVKYYKITAQKVDKPSGVLNVQPIGEITTNFEIVINELNQATKLIK